VISTADVLYNVTGQSLILDCPDGRPSAITSVAVYETSADDTGTAESATTGSAAISDPNTTVDATSGAGQTNPKLLYVAATTGGTTGQRIRVTSAKGHYEDAEIVDVTSADYFTLRHPLLNSYASGDTVGSTRCSISVDSTWVATLENVSPAFSPNPRYRVRWTVVVGGSTKVYDRYFDLVRYAAQHGVSPLDVNERHPGWLDALGPDDRANQGRALIDDAFAMVKGDLYGDGKADQSIRNAELLAELVLACVPLATVTKAALVGGDVSPARLDLANRHYRQRYDQLVRSPVMPVDLAGGGASTSNTPTPIWRR
jgi:hypothetical protein